MTSPPRRQARPSPVFLPPEVHRDPFERDALYGDDFAGALAACSITFATTSGWEMNATWLDLTSLVLAFIRFA